MSAQLHARNVTVERGGLSVLHDVSLTVAPGDRIGLVGPNGVGKSTLLQLLAGRLVPTSGSVELIPHQATVGLLAQELDTAPGETVADYVARRIGVAEASDELDRATEALAGSDPAAMDRHQAALDRWMRLGGADLDGRLAGALGAVGFDRPGSSEAGAVPEVGSASPAEWQTEVLSGGEQARVGLAALMLSRYDVMLLDEPTNNLDAEGLAQLEDLLVAAQTPLVVVSHDRRFLERVVTAVIELDERTHGLTRYNEAFLGYLAARDLARQEAERRFIVYRSERSRLDDRARQQRQWAVKGVKAERNPADNDRAARGFRLDRTEKLASKARQTERALERLDEVEKPWEPWQLRFSIGQAERSGDLVAELVEARVQMAATGETTFELGPVSLSVGAGERLAVLGGNGQGKTTLLKALFGQIPLDLGRQRLGRSVVVGWLDQARHRLTSTDRFLDRFTDDTGLNPGEARSLLAKFGLGTEHLSRPSTRWSPGERTRAVLAAFAAQGVNTVVLDEPTNHLDLPAIEQLEQALGRFQGTLVLVTHDRAFLDNVTLTRQIVVDHGRITSDRPC